MNKPSIRQNILRKSVQSLLDADEQVTRVAMLSTRHRWFVPYAIASGIALFVVATVLEIEPALSRYVLAVCGMAIAGMATTNHHVLAETTTGLVLLRSSRVRQYAKALGRRVDSTTPVTMVGSNLITSDWKIDSVIYTTTKRWEATMQELQR